jgi:hypothetical protein
MYTNTTHSVRCRTCKAYFPITDCQFYKSFLSQSRITLCIHLQGLLSCSIFGSVKLYYTAVGLGFDNCVFLRAVKSPSCTKLFRDVLSCPQLFTVKESCSDLQKESCQVSLLICLYPSGSSG